MRRFVRFSDDLDEGKFRGPFNADVEAGLALGDMNLGDVDVEVADVVRLELTLAKLVSPDLGQAGDAMVLQAVV